MKTERFEVKEDHIKLLNKAYVDWNCDCFGSPSINCIFGGSRLRDSDVESCKGDKKQQFYDLIASIASKRVENKEKNKIKNDKNMGAFSMFGGNGSDNECTCGCRNNQNYNSIEPSVFQKEEESKVKKSANPNPNNFKIVRFEEVDTKDGILTVVEVNYPDCTNYEGNKVMIFESSYDNLKKLTSLDPHFQNNKNILSPIARFEPTERGWNAAVNFCNSGLWSYRKVAFSDIEVGMKFYASNRFDIESGFNGAKLTFYGFCTDSGYAMFCANQILLKQYLSKGRIIKVQMAEKDSTGKLRWFYIKDNHQNRKIVKLSESDIVNQGIILESGHWCYMLKGVNWKTELI